MAGKRKATEDDQVFTSSAAALKKSKHELAAGVTYANVTTPSGIKTGQTIKNRPSAVANGDQPVRRLPAPSLDNFTRRGYRTPSLQHQAAVEEDDKKIAKLWSLLGQVPLTTPLQDAQWQARKYEGDNERLSAENAKMSNREREQAEELSKAKDEVANLKRKLEDERAASQRALKDERAESKRYLDDERADLDRARGIAATNEAKVKQLIDENVVLQQSLKTARTDVASASDTAGRLAALEAENKRLSNEVAGYKRSTAQLKEQSERLTKENADYNAQIVKLEQEKKHLTKQSAGHSDHITQLGEEKKRLGKENADSHARIVQLEEQNKLHYKEAGEYEAKTVAALSRLQHEKQTTEAKLADTRNQLEQVKIVLIRAEAYFQQSRPQDGRALQDMSRSVSGNHQSYNGIDDSGLGSSISSAQTSSPSTFALSSGLNNTNTIVTSTQNQRVESSSAHNGSTQAYNGPILFGDSKFGGAFKPDHSALPNGYMAQASNGATQPEAMEVTDSTPSMPTQPHATPNNAQPGEMEFEMDNDTSLFIPQHQLPAFGTGSTGTFGKPSYTSTPSHSAQTAAGGQNNASNAALPSFQTPTANIAQADTMEADTTNDSLFVPLEPQVPTVNTYSAPRRARCPFEEEDYEPGEKRPSFDWLPPHLRPAAEPTQTTIETGASSSHSEPYDVVQSVENGDRQNVDVAIENERQESRKRLLRMRREGRSNARQPYARNQSAPISFFERCLEYQDNEGQGEPKSSELSTEVDSLASKARAKAALQRKIDSNLDEIISEARRARNSRMNTMNKTRRAPYASSARKTSRSPAPEPTSRSRRSRSPGPEPPSRSRRSRSPAPPPNPSSLHTYRETPEKKAMWARVMENLRRREAGLEPIENDNAGPNSRPKPKKGPALNMSGTTPLEPLAPLPPLGSDVGGHLDADLLKNLNIGSFDKVRVDSDDDEHEGDDAEPCARKEASVSDRNHFDRVCRDAQRVRANAERQRRSKKVGGGVWALRG